MLRLAGGAVALRCAVASRGCMLAAGVAVVVAMVVAARLTPQAHALLEQQPAHHPAGMRDVRARMQH